MTDKEKVVQLLLDNGFIQKSKLWNMFKNEDYRILVSAIDDSINIIPFNGEDSAIVYSYLELVGFLYLKYGKVYITK